MKQFLSNHACKRMKERELINHFDVIHCWNDGRANERSLFSSSSRTIWLSSPRLSPPSLNVNIISHQMDSEPVDGTTENKLSAVSSLTKFGSKIGINIAKLS